MGLVNIRRLSAFCDWSHLINSQAKTFYRAGLSVANDPTNNPLRYDKVLSVSVKLDYLRLLVILHSNMLQVELKHDTFPPSGLLHGLRAQRYLSQIQQLMDSPAEYTAAFGQLEEKVQYRMRLAWLEIGPVLRFAEFSEQPVEGIQQGTMLTHNDRGFGSIFESSRVLMTEFTPNSVVGVIVNKTLTRTVRARPRSAADGKAERESKDQPETQTIYIGGPCENDVITVLHNQQSAAGSRRIIEGVYLGGDLSGLEGNPGVIVRRYYGYASWFPGQLEGEVLNAGGWEHTNAITAADVFDVVPVDMTDNFEDDNDMVDDQNVTQEDDPLSIFHQTLLEEILGEEAGEAGEEADKTGEDADEHEADEVAEIFMQGQDRGSNNSTGEQF